MTINLGDAFVIRTPPHTKHLYFVIALIPENTYLLFNTTTSNKNLDLEKDCIIYPGINVPKFITCQCSVYFKRPLIYSKKKLQIGIKNRSILYAGKFSLELINEIQKKTIAHELVGCKYQKIIINDIYRREILQFYI